jgi:hypothetical protein
LGVCAAASEAAVYAAAVEHADDWYPAFKESPVDGLVRVVEGDLVNNPSLHYRPHPGTASEPLELHVAHERESG